MNHLTNSLSETSLADLHVALCARNLSSVELTQYCIDQHNKPAGQIFNAYKLWDADHALQTAELADAAFERGQVLGPMQGIPISIKDLYGLSGYPIFAGSKISLPKKFQKSGPIVHLLQNQHAVVIGKTHTVEFAYGGLGVNHHWGTPRNPWNVENHRVPGGSSSGAGVSLCEGSALAALGTDTAGSVRVPASFTGTVGLKTSAGRWPTQGIVPLSPSFDTAGILTKTVQDSAYAFSAIDGLDNNRKNQQAELYRISEMSSSDFKIGMDEGFMWTSTCNSIARCCLNAVQDLESDGCALVAIEFPEADNAIELRNLGSTVSAELLEFLQFELPQCYEALDPIIKERTKIGGDISAIELLNRMRRIRRLRQDVVKRFETVDVIVSPTVPISPPLLDDVSTPEKYMPLNLMALQNTTVGSFLNLCAISIPVGLDRFGLPVGLQFMALAGNEHILLAIGQRLQSIVPPPRLKT